MESESKSIIWKYGVTLKSTALACTLNGLLIHTWPCTSYTGIGKYWFTELCRPSKQWHILFYNTKIIFINTHWFHQKSQKFQEAVKLTVIDTNFSKLQFLPKNSKAKKDYQLFSLKGQAYCIHFQENNQVWIIIICSFK
jgi:hypothetical protein